MYCNTIESVNKYRVDGNYDHINIFRWRIMICI